LTIVLGAAFLAGTAYEWWELITVHGLTISTNLFGTTFYTLVGFHGLHVSMGLVALSVILALTLRGEITGRHAIATEMVSWYWHFVDVVWVAVFSVVYVFGR
jgi:cytochrome c oxidase subunit 3/cytochrome o ubiquinol oxidase subunit 3